MDLFENVTNYKVTQIFKIYKFYFDSFYIRGRLQNLNFKFENFTRIFYDKMISNKKLSITKFHYISRPTTFILVDFHSS
jgi:hypothetical protein